MKRIRVGVVGCGVLGSRHAEIYRQLPGVQLTAVYDILPERGAQLARSLGANAAKNLKAMIGGVDAVSVCTPALAHYATARPFLEAGIHVMIEKPITTRLEDADDLLRIASKKKLILQTGHIERFNGAVGTVKRLVKNPIYIECDRIGLFDPRISDVGVVLDLMIHDIDIVLYLVRSRVKAVQAVGMNILSRTEDFANGRIEFENGAVCNLTASRMAQKRLRKIRIFERDRYISLDYFRQEAQTFTRDSAGSPETPYHPIDIRKTNPLEEELKDFVACIRKRKRPEVGGREGRAALAVALQILDGIHRH